MIRQVIKIDEDKCIGCGLCAQACHEGAIGMVQGKATLLRDDYCDGLGNCLPVCPTGAIRFEKREASSYNRDVAPKRQLHTNEGRAPLGGCPGSNAKTLAPKSNTAELNPNILDPNPPLMTSKLAQWPVQIQLVPVNAPYFDNANLLVAADCAAYAYADFHNQFMKNKITLIGCPKLDTMEYTDKLTAIIRENNIKSVTVIRMEVPCCGGIEQAVKNALQNSGKFIPWQVVTISTDGEIVE